METSASRPPPSASSLRAGRGMSLRASRFRPTSSKIFGMGAPLPVRRASGSTVCTARRVARISKVMRVGKRPSKWRRGWQKAKRLLKEKAIVQMMFSRKRSTRRISMGSSRIEHRSMQRQLGSNETLASKRQSATPSITKTLPTQNRRATYMIHRGFNASQSNISPAARRTTLRFSHPVVDAMIPGLPTPAVMSPIPATPAPDGFDHTWTAEERDSSSYDNTASHWSASTSMTPTSAAFDGQVQPEIVAEHRVRNSVMELTVPQALNQLDGVPQNLQGKVELPRSVTRRATRRSTFYEKNGYRQTAASSIYLAKPLPFDARGLTSDLENCNGETDVPADVARQNALNALEGGAAPETSPALSTPTSSEGEQSSPALLSPTPSERHHRRQVAASSLYLARPHPFDANRLTQDLERCNGQGAPSEYEREDALQTLEGGLPARKLSDVPEFLEKYAVESKKTKGKKRATCYPGKEEYGNKRYTAFHPSMLPEPLSTPKSSRHTDSQVVDDSAQEKSAKGQYREASVQDFADMQPHVSKPIERRLRKSRLDRSLPPSPPASPPSPHRKSIVLDNGYPPLGPTPSAPIKRKPVTRAQRPAQVPPQMMLSPTDPTAFEDPRTPPPVPTGHSQPPQDTRAQIAMYREMARIHEEQGRLMKEYADRMSRQFGPAQFPTPEQGLVQQVYAPLPVIEQQQSYQQQLPVPRPVRQEGGAVDWKRTMKKAIMKDW